MLQYKHTAHFGDVSPQRHSSDGNNETIFDNELQNDNQQNVHQKSGPGWIQRAETKKLPRYKMMKTNQQSEQQQQQHNCPGVLRSHIHCTRFRNPFSAPHITIPSQREEKKNTEPNLRVSVEDLSHLRFLYITDISTVWGYPATILCYQGTLAPHLLPLYSSLSFRKYPWRLFASEDGRSWAWWCLTVDFTDCFSANSLSDGLKN